ncbi:MAG TPA: hypothetical protein VF772_16440 [Terriglobales bacterium]
MSRCWLIILLLLPLVVAQPQDRPVLLAAHRVGRVELLDVDTLQPVGSLRVLPLADRAIIASKEIILLREGLPPNFRGCCALYALDLKTRNLTKLLEPVLGITVSPDGQHVVTQRGNIGIEIFDVHTLHREPSIPRSIAPGMYGLSFSPDGHLLFGTSNFPSPAVDVLDFNERKLVRRLTLPEGFAIHGTWVGDDYYVYGYRKATGELWRVKTDGSELGTPVKVNLPFVAPECELHDQGILGDLGRLLVFELFGGKGDRRGGCSKDIPGGVFLVNPQSGRQIAHIAPELHFAQLISRKDGAELYGIDLASPDWTSIALVRLNATTGQILVRQNLPNDVWFIDLASIPEELVPHGQVEANPSLR